MRWVKVMVPMDDDTDLIIPPVGERTTGGNPTACHDRSTVSVGGRRYGELYTLMRLN